MKSNDKQGVQMGHIYRAPWYNVPSLLTVDNGGQLGFSIILKKQICDRGP